MASIDERIVEMTFKGTQFVAGVRGTIEALASLKNSLNGLKGSEKDINNLDSAGKRFSLSHISSGIDSIASKFKAMSVVGIAALSTLASAATFAGLRIVKALTIDPIRAGLDVYETKINAIQTILANTSAAGTTLKQVTNALNLLNIYANKTVYNFGQMAKNIGTFTAAGVGLNQAVASIKGIANLAALSGSSAEQASGAMYQLSQAIATGALKLQDWNSVVNAGLGGKVFQNAIIQTARVNGVQVDAMIKKYGSFRAALQTGFVTSKILTEALSLFTGDLTAKQIRAMGFTQQETKALLAQGAMAVKSATQIRTITQLMQALKEEIATAWAGVFEAIIGNSKEAASTLSSFHTVAENALTQPIKNIANVLTEFNKLGGRDVVLNTITLAFHNLGLILHTVGEAFHEVFPPGGGSAAQSLFNIATALHSFIAALTPSAATLQNFKDIFAGLFSAVKIVIDVIRALVGGLFQIGSAAAGTSGGFLAILAAIGRFVSRIREAVESGTALTTFFRTLGQIIAFPIKVLSAIIDKFTLFGGAANAAGTAVGNIIQKIGDAFSKLGSVIAKGIENGDISQVASVLNKLLLGGVLLSVKKFIDNLGKGSGGGGLFATIKESFESLTNTLKTMQASLKAGILQKIAIAVALLAASMVALSLVDVKNLTKALAAMTVMFTQLLGAMAIVIKLGGAAGILQMEAVALALNLLASAIVILAGAVAILAQFSWDQLAKGLAAIAVLLTELVVATSLMSKNVPGLVATAFAMNVMGVALNILALAVKQLGSLDLSTLAKGIGSIAVLLAIMAGFNAISGVQLIGTSVAMLVLGAALEVIANVVEKLGSLSVGTLAKGLVSVALALGIIAIAMQLMPPSMLVTAVSLLLVASALVILSQALTAMGGMSWEAIAKSLIVLAASLVIIAGAMVLMTEALPGAAALIVVAAALAILTPVLLALGAMSWESIAKGLTALVGVFVVLAAAGILLTPLIPTLLGIAAAIALMGVGVAAAGAGIFLIATGLTALAVAVTASGAAVASFVGSILAIIPNAFRQLGLGIVQLVTQLGNSAAAIENAFVKIVSALLDGVAKVAPKAAKAFDALMTALLGAINKNAPRILNTFVNLLLNILSTIQGHVGQFISKGAAIIVAFLNGIANRIGSVIRAGTNVVIAFINGISNNMLRITQAGFQAIIHFVRGLTDQIKASSGQLRSAGGSLAFAIVDGLTFGLAGAVSRVVSAAFNLGKSAISAIGSAIRSGSPSKAAFELGGFIGQGLALGMADSVKRVVPQAEKVGNEAIKALRNTLSGASDLITENIDINPVIAPVIDLSAAKRGFDDLAAMSRNQLLNASVSSGAAASISAANTSAEAEISAGGTSGNTVTFNQYNNSPKELSAADIYRRTRNQLSVAKGVLTNANGS